MQITRKCSLCKELIDIQGDDYLVQNKSFKHILCWANDKYTKQKRTTYTFEECLALATQKGESSRPAIKEQIEGELVMKNLLDFIADTYQIVNFPQYFFVKINEVLNGTRKGLRVAIPPDHLLDMWKRRMPKLDKIHVQTVTMGKDIQGIGRVYYDLGVLVGEYESYLKWKQQQQEVEKSKVGEQLYTQVRLTQHVQPKSKPKEEKINIYDILDEI